VAKRRPPKARTIDISGVWSRADAPYYHECCECHLTHYVEHKLEDGVLWMRWNAVDLKQPRRPRRSSKG